jgi:hypothetical protein
MAFLSSMFGKKSQSPTSLAIRDTLFGDMPLDQWPSNDAPAEAFPWSAFVAARSSLAAGNLEAALASWREILAHPGLEPRQYLQAWHFLRQQGIQPPSEIAKDVLGVVVEVAMPKGLDLLAAYPDRSARYYNFSGSAIVWEHPDDSLDLAIDQLLAASKAVVARIGPWDKARPEPPPRDNARLSFLTPSGLHFGQGPMSALSRDPTAGRVLNLAVRLMQAMIQKAKPA